MKLHITSVGVDRAGRIFFECCCGEKKTGYVNRTDAEKSARGHAVAARRQEQGRRRVK